MIKFIVIPIVVMLSCGTTKTNQSATTDTVIVEEPGGVMYQRDSAILPEEANTALPGCIKSKIDSFKMKEVHERPQRVVEYKYKGKKVYYVVMQCCDFFSEVYDEHCKFLGSPDGGFTGKGDGKLPDFFAEAKEEKLVWGTAIPK